MALTMLGCCNDCQRCVKFTSRACLSRSLAKEAVQLHYFARVMSLTFYLRMHVTLWLSLAVPLRLTVLDATSSKEVLTAAVGVHGPFNE